MEPPKALTAANRLMLLRQSPPCAPAAPPGRWTPGAARVHGNCGGGWQVPWTSAGAESVSAPLPSSFSSPGAKTRVRDTERSVPSRSHGRPERRASPSGCASTFVCARRALLPGFYHRRVVNVLRVLETKRNAFPKPTGRGGRPPAPHTGRPLTWNCSPRRLWTSLA